MKVDSRIVWHINEPKLAIINGMVEVIPIDADYVEADEAAIIEAIESELCGKYGAAFYACRNDFKLLNLEDIIEDIKFDEFESCKSECGM